MSYSVIDVKDFEGRRTPVARALGALAIKANQFDSQPHQAGHVRMWAAEAPLVSSLSTRAMHCRRNADRTPHHGPLHANTA
jgi:hypothetical protein